MHSRGFTAIEILVTITIVGILASLAVPSYQRLIERNRLKEAIQSVKSDLQLARTEAFKQSSNIHLDFINGNSGAWCFGADSQTCECTDTNSDAADDCTLLVTPGARFDQISLYNSNDGEIDFRRGTTAAVIADFRTTNYTARISVNPVGRVEVCNTDPQPAGTEALYDACD